MTSQPSGLYYSNKLARITLLALEDVMGRHGVNAILNLAGLSRLINNYPPDNNDKTFAFEDYAAICAALEAMYGPRSGRGLAIRAGRACFSQGLQQFGALAGVGSGEFKMLPVDEKIVAGLRTLAEIFSNYSDQQTTVGPHAEGFEYVMQTCPMCTGRTSMDGKPLGHVGMGVLREGLSWVSGGKEFRVEETECMATGGKVGRYVIYRDPIG